MKKISSKFVLLIYALLFTAFAAMAQPNGANMSKPIQISFPNPPISDVKNNSPSNYFGNDIGNPSHDIYYRVYLTEAGELTASTCMSSFDTYMYILDANGSILASNDDNSYCAGPLQASLKMNLLPGTYYVVVEGWSNYSGNIYTYISFAQDNTAGQAYTKTVDDILQNLDKTRIPTGVLYDRAFPLAGIQSFNATQPDTSSSKHFLQGYAEMISSAYDQSGWIQTDDVERIIQTKSLSSLPNIPIGLSNYEFNVVDTNAIENGQITQIDSTLYDASATSNPYITLYTVMGSPLLDSVNSPSNTIAYNFSPSLIFNKSANTINSVSVDFNDGVGDRVIDLSTEQYITATYSSSGFKFLKFTFGLSNGATKVTYAGILVNVNVNSSPPNSGNCNLTEETEIVSDIPFQGYDESSASVGRGQVKIFYAKTSCDKIIRKPIIILDGFDPQDTRSPDILYNEYLNSLDRGGKFADELRDEGHDIIVLNFPKYKIGTATIPFFNISFDILRDGGADYIERNAMVLIKLIDSINTIKQGAEKLVIIGPSMGGLISRYALAYMEQNSMLHHTKLWVSFDSPHKGANIAIGDQYFLDYYAGLSPSAKKNRDTKIGSVAAKQMLVHHYLAESYPIAGAPGFRDRFQTALDNIGFPSGDPGQPFHKIALINGSLGGNLVNSPGQKGFTFDVRHEIRINLFIFKWKIKVRTFTAMSAKMYFTPAYGTSGSNVLEANKPLWHRTIKEAYTPPYTMGYDCAPGGTFATQEILREQGQVGLGPAYSHTVAGQFLNIMTGGLFNASAKFYSVVPTHSFINTKSALGFTGSNQDLAENVSTRNLVCTQETPFDSYYGDFNLNRDHVELWSDAITWIKSAINGTIQDPPVLSTTRSIVGPETICSGSSYYISNSSSVTSVNWTASGNISISGSSSGTSVNVISTASSGSGTLTATLSTNSGSCGQEVITRNIEIGNRIFPYGELMVYGDQIPNVGNYSYYSMPDYPDAISYEWQVYNENGYQVSAYPGGPYNKELQVVYYYPGQYLVKAKVITPCGELWLDNQALTVQVYDPYGGSYYTYSFSPNPADNELTIERRHKPSKDRKDEKDVSFEVKVIDQKGKVIRRASNRDDSEKVVINTLDINEGTYFLHIKEGKDVIKRQIIIKH